MDANDRLAIITGTSSGIGEALARALLLIEGWSVLGMARRAAPIDDPGYEHLEIDLGDIKALGALAQRKIEPMLVDGRWQRVGLVNNAATEGFYRSVADTRPEELAGVFAVNSIAPIQLMGIAARAVPMRTPLRIVNLSTGAAHRGIPGLVDYGSSKAALRLAGMTLASEFEASRDASGIRRDAAVLSYAPGVVDTPMQERARNATPDSFPSKQIFVDFVAQGMLNPPDLVVGEIVDFLDGESEEAFQEHRFEG